MTLKKNRIGIVDYGFGNITSLENALDYLKLDYTSLKNPKDLKNFSHLFLPGVGAFEAGINKLKKMKWDNKIHEFVENGGYLFGICLGMQLLFKYGTNEKTNQEIKGLGFFDGKCEKFFTKCDNKLPLPHVGFNQVEHLNTKVWKNIKNPSYFYFVHSYRANYKKNQNKYLFTDYGERFTSFVEKSNIFGSQFHPEKSHLVGLELIKNFCELK